MDSHIMDSHTMESDYMASHSDASNWTVSSACPNCNHPIRVKRSMGSTAHASHSFMSHILYLDRSCHRIFRPHTTRSSTIGGEDREAVSMRGWNFASYFSDFTVEDTLSVIEGSSESNSTTPATVSNKFNEQLYRQGFSTFTENFSRDTMRCDPASAIQFAPKALNGFELDNHELDPIFSKNVDILHYDDFSSYFPTCWNENISFLSDSESLLLSLPVQGFDFGIMDCGPSPRNDIPLQDINASRPETFFSIEIVKTTEDIPNSPPIAHSDGIPENTPVFHPQPNDQGRFACTIPGCTRSYKRYPELKRHKEIHSDIDPPHACTVPRCNRKGVNGFRRRDHLRQHLKHVHGITI